MQEQHSVFRGYLLRESNFLLPIAHNASPSGMKLSSNLEKSRRAVFQCFWRKLQCSADAWCFSTTDRDTRDRL